MVSGGLSGFPAFAILFGLNTNLKLHFISLLTDKIFFVG